MTDPTAAAPCKAKACVLLLAVFLAGGGTGYFAGRWHAAYEFRAAMQASFPPDRTAAFRPRGEQRGDAFIERLSRDLSLRPEQREEIVEILRRQHERIIEFRQQMDPRIEELLEETRAEVRAHLDPPQRAVFDQIVRRFQERRRRFHERMMRGMMGGPRGGMMGGPRGGMMGSPNGPPPSPGPTGP